MSVDANTPPADALLKVFEAPLSDGDRRAIGELLRQVQNGEMIDHVAELLQWFSVLIEVNKTVSQSISLDQLLPRLIDVITGVLHCDRATLFLNDDEAGELFSRVLQADGVNEIRFPNSAGIAGSVFTSGETLIIPDAYADSRFNPEVDKRTGYRTRDILCAPLRNRDGQAIGVTQLLNKMDGAFQEDDARLLESLTTQASAALEHAQLFERVEKSRQDEITFIEATSAVSTDLDLDSLLSKVMRSTTHLLEAERSTLFIHDPETDELWSRVAEGLASKDLRIPSTAGFAGEAFTSGEVLNIPDAYADPRFNPEIDRKTGFRTRSILCMPLINKLGQSIAVMQVLNKVGGPFSKRDEQRLRAFSAQVAVALENAKLFQDVLRLKNYNEGILRSLSNGVVTMDADLKITKLNEAAIRILSVDEEQLVGRSAQHVFSNANDWLVRSLDYVIETNGNDYHADTDLRREGAEEVSVNATVAPLLDVKDEPLGYMIVFEDITGEKRFRSTMARYLAKEVVDKVLESSDESFLASAQEATVLFSDIRGFTTISETIGPTETVNMLNEYFSDMVEVVLRYGGLLDKYIGDAIMAVFGAPVVDPYDADNAVTVAIEMVRELRRFNARRSGRGADPIDIGIGVSTGEVIAGSVGSTKRMDYTVIGDSVNLAARLESANKFFGTSVLISGTTVKQLQQRRALREIDLIRVKGKEEPIAVYEPLDYLRNEQRITLERTLDAYGAAIGSFRTRDWRGAIEGFREVLGQVPDDAPSKLYIDRCRYYEKVPPDEEWDGVWTLTEK